MSPADQCQAETLTDGTAPAICTLPPGHPGLHWDAIVGREW